MIESPAEFLSSSDMSVSVCNDVSCGLLQPNTVDDRSVIEFIADNGILFVKQGSNTRHSHQMLPRTE